MATYLLRPDGRLRTCDVPARRPAPGGPIPQGSVGRTLSLEQHSGWTLELAFDEVKTEVLDREETIRSKSPKGVEQEVWGIFLAYNLVRLEMERVADEAGVPPTRISFITSLHLIRDECIWAASASPGAIPRHLRKLRANIARFILPPRRSERIYPRAVKIKMSSYPRNRPSAGGGDAK